MVKHPMTTAYKQVFAAMFAFSTGLSGSGALAAESSNLTWPSTYPCASGILLAEQVKDKAKLTGQSTTVAPKTVSFSTPIKIGFITSLTGAAAPSAQFMVNGIKLYMDQIHYQMGGHKVDLIIENDESNPAKGMAMYRKLVEDDKCDIIAGLALANVGYAIAPLCDKYKIPTCYVISAGDDLTQRQHHDWIVRTGWNSSQPSQPFGEWVFKTLKYKRVVTLGMDYQFGWEVVGGFQKTFEDAGGKVVQKIWAPLGFTDFSRFIKEIRKDADAVFIVTFGKAAVVFPKQYKEMGPKLPLIGGGSSVDETILSQAGDDAIGTVTPMCYSAALTTPANKKFAAAYKAKDQGNDPSFYAESAYSCGMWINKAITSLKGNVSNKNDLLAALKNVSLKDLPRGPERLDDRANPIQNVYVRKVEKVNGHLQNTVIHTFPDVSQYWKYTADEFLKQPVYSKDFPACKYCSP
jgi:branched-chain amino acid transport system substrate-binding protein